MGSEDIFDKKTLDSSFSGDEDILVEIIHDLVDQVPKHIMALHLALKQCYFKKAEVA